MTGFLSYLRKFIRIDLPVEPTVEPEKVLNGTESDSGVISVRDQLTKWKRSYTEEYTDFLTVQEAVQRYEEATKAIEDLDPLLNQKASYDDDVVDAASTLKQDLQEVVDFIAQRDEYNDKWLDRMEDKHGTELNSYFENPDFTHTKQQFRAIFSNDNFNRVNAAAGTGKTTTFGRRVQFILSEYDDVAASDLLAFTFTRNGRDEMKKELEETFDITGVDVRTINSYSKAVAEDQYSELEFIIGEAKTTEIASIWRDVRADTDLQETYEQFLTAWKEERYDPNDMEVVEGAVESLSEKSTVTIQGEDLDKDDIPEEAVAHQAIARYLTTRKLEYDFKTHIEWASSPSGGYTLDFKLLNNSSGESIYIQYCVSEETRSDRPRYRNVDSEQPETIRRIFSSNDKQSYDPSGKTAIVLDGGNLLENPSDQFNWNDERAVEQFETIIKNELERQLKEVGIDVSAPLRGEEFSDYVYDRKILYHDIVSKVADYINQARVREWEPDRAQKEAAKFIESEGEDIDDGVPEFVELCDAAYREFTGVFDNRTKTDFHGSVVLTRDLLQAGKVDEDYLYKHVFVDEMQDLNQVQFSAVKHLSEQLSDVRMFGVGDDWQSIFGFQGARPDLFINFGNELGAGEFDSVETDPVEVFTDDNPLLSEYNAFVDTRLEDNYRCPDTVVNASNAVIKNNKVRTEKDPSGLPGGELITIHHLSCDTFPNKLNQSMIRKVRALIKQSPHEPSETQVLLRQKDGDPAFFFPLKSALPDTVDIRTAHNAKGSEAEHVIIPKVVQNQGYPSIQGDKWVEPVERPPEIYEKHDTSYQLEEERRLFYVALTRAESELDVLTVQGAESVFIDELPDDECEHVRSLTDSELKEIETNNEICRSVTGTVDGMPNEYFATFDWDEGDLISVNLYDASDEQKQRLQQFSESGQTITLDKCKIRAPNQNNENGDDTSPLQMKIDKEVSISE